MKKRMPCQSSWAPFRRSNSHRIFEDNHCHTLHYTSYKHQTCGQVYLYQSLSAVGDSRDFHGMVSNHTGEVAELELYFCTSLTVLCAFITPINGYQHQPKSFIPQSPVENARPHSKVNHLSWNLDKIELRCVKTASDSD